MSNAFPDLQAEIEDIFGSGDRVAGRIAFRGTHQGDLEDTPGRSMLSYWATGPIPRAYEPGS